MSAIPYATPIVNDTFTTAAGTRQEIVSGLEAKFTAAGWSTISGGGTGDVVMKSAVTPAPKGNSVRVRLLDPGAGAFAQLFLKDDGILVSQAYSLTTGVGKTFRVIACPYSAWVMVDGSILDNDFVMLGTAWIPTFLEGLITGSFGTIMGAFSTFRTTLRAGYNTNLLNGSMVNLNGYTGNSNAVLSFLTDEWGTGPLNCWHDGSLQTYEAALAFSPNAVDVRRTRGLLYNAMMVRAPFPLDDLSIVNYDGHAWRIVSSYGGGSIALALAIS